ncbi:hypothetical protein HMPREF9442_03370 [Paraprevotella xylaniphila YIT 11841]|uniref:Uncharacterized protein n=1 Tax=Paraprevotella xylaniphila YIT 11841 TaxID=762982 RepID=F3QYS6_9BACT|nr:hypothetical protein HMPREF9442_03370 [Paraprevotella xylaniphila YIT 11841]
MYSLPLTLYTVYEQRREKAQREETFFRFNSKKNVFPQKRNKRKVILYLCMINKN